MDYVQRYIYAVTQKLPEGQREEIRLELEGLIEDMLDERTQGGPVTDGDIEAVLRELGSPHKLADQYRARPRYLIGPGFFDAYISVLRIVLISIGIGLSASFAVEALITPAETLQHFISYIVSIITIGVQGFAWVTVTFAIIEYAGVKPEDLNKSKREWSLADLPEIPDRRLLIKRGEPIVGIIFSVLFAVLFTFSVELIGVIVFRENFREVVPIFNVENFARYLPLIWGLTALSILKESVKIIFGKWTRGVVLSHVALNALTFILLVIMFKDSEVWNPYFVDQLVQLNILTPGSEAFEWVQTIWGGGQHWLISIVAIVTAIDIVSVCLKVYPIHKGAMGNVKNH
ncbi:hypothetical protein GNP95_18230 [Paenibacillus woosongensis]|uniref:Uncharacterized protein n=1 Tax=Paenibacillus woosongensis TaxID=307580 RepID=A0A7X3CP24_9BACL|nr:hypothetical protein [Paenibacillus woosongensis]MUG46915.1 hypothetical protein [Paenibacillus woosongensis]